MLHDQMLLTKNARLLSMDGVRGLRAFRVKDLEVDGCEVSLGEIATALGVVTSGFFSAPGQVRVVLAAAFGYFLYAKAARGSRNHSGGTTIAGGQP